LQTVNFWLLWGILWGLSFSLVDWISPLILRWFQVLCLLPFLQLLGFACCLDVSLTLHRRFDLTVFVPGKLT
jgi:hypothetical protein